MAWGWALAAGGSLLGSYLSAQGSQTSAATQAQAQEAAAQVQQNMFNRITAQQQPFIQTGYNASNALNYLMGFGNTDYGMGNMGNMGYGGNYSVPPGGGFTPSSGGSPGFGTGGGTMPGAMTPTGMQTSINAGAGQNFGYGNDYTGAGIYGPQTIQMGGQETTGAPGTNWGGIAGGIMGGLAGSPLAAMMGYKALGGGPQDVSFNGQNVNTDINKTNLQPTNITIPKSNLNTPGMIIDPKTGGPVGAAYYSTPEGQKAAFRNALALGHAQSDLANNIVNTAQGRLRQKAKYGGVVGDSTLPASVTVGEDGPEKVHMMPGSMAWVEPNPGTMEKMRKGTQLPRSGGGGLPGKLLGGMIGNMGAPAGNLANSLALKRAGMIQPSPAQPMSYTPPASAPISGPVQNAIGGAGSQPVYSPTPVHQPFYPMPRQPIMGGTNSATWRPTGSTGGFGTGGTGAMSGPVGGFGTPGLTGVSSATNAPGGSPFQTSGGPGAGYLTQTFNPTLSDLMNYPGYQFQLQQGDLGVMNQQAVTGSALSGAAQKALANYNQGLAASTYGDYFNQFQTQQNNIFNRLYQLSQMGQNAAGNLGGFGAQLGTGIAQAGAAAGGSLAAGQLGAANAYAGAANTIPLYMLMAGGG